MTGFIYKEGDKKFCKRPLFSRAVVLLAVFVTVACGTLPRDPNGTLKRAVGSRLRIGLVENPPWVIRTGSEPAGAEVELLRTFAAEISAEPEWYWGGEQQTLEALEKFELDVVAGGFSDSTPWSSRIGMTSPYFENRIMVGAPSSLFSSLNDIRGVQVGVRAGTPAAALLERKNAVPIRFDDLGRSAGLPTAAPEWELEKLGLPISNIELNKENHVVFVPPGENQLIKRLDEFLAPRRAGMKQLLRDQSERAEE